jgi:hypothetical protein
MTQQAQLPIDELINDDGAAGCPTMSSPNSRAAAANGFRAVPM